jgi:hypothetical protein
LEEVMSGCDWDEWDRADQAMSNFDPEISDAEAKVRAEQDRLCRKFAEERIVR